MDSTVNMEDVGAGSQAAKKSGAMVDYEKLRAVIDSITTSATQVGEQQFKPKEEQ